MTRTRLPFAAVVFDCDGVLVDSFAAVELCWRQLAVELGLPADELLSTIHGVRAVDTLRPRVAPANLDAAIARLEDLELAAACTTHPVPGARELVDDLSGRRWGVATSGSRRLASARLLACGFPAPTVLIGADDVAHGKPSPEPYLAAAARLGVSPSRVVVLEDSASGAESAHRAGATVIAVATTFPPGTFGAEVTVPDLRAVTLDGDALVVTS